MNTKSAFKIIGVILAVAIVVFGGIGITGAAAQATIPGDALYPVKTTIESTRLSLAQDAGDRAQMNLAFAKQRLAEIRSLIDEGRVTQIRKAVLAFEANINSAIIELETVSASEPSRAAAIAQEVVSALTRYAQTLSDLAAIAPDSIKSEVIRALDTTQIATGLSRSGEDNHVNGNENNDDHSVDNGNDNSNDNDDSNTNANMNNNANDNSATDDNGNDNASLDDNGNDTWDDHSNMNANDNSNVDNSNSTVDDNGNSTDDGNGNDDNGGHGGDDKGGHGRDY